MELQTVESIYAYLKKREEEQPVLLLHGTTLSSMKEIANNHAFIPQKKNGSDALANHYPEEHFLGFVFFTDDMDNAGHYSTLACSNTGEYDNRNIQTIVGAIIPQQILLPNLCDAPQAKDWKESLKSINSVCMKGELLVPAENLFLLFSDYDTGDPLYLTTELDVEKAFKKALELQGKLQ